jgi:hypothetical protein
MPGDEILRVISKNLRELVDRDPARALELFFALVEQDNAHAREVAADGIAQWFAGKCGEDLNPDVRRQFVRKWVRLLRDDDEGVREAVFLSLEEALQPEWVEDEETAAILDEGMINGWRWENRI